jgi:CheY-like chemotaxis protein
MSKQQYVVGILDLPEHEQVILRMIFSVSQKSAARANAYTLAESGWEHADVVICDAQSPRAKVAGGAPRLNVADRAPERIDDALILRPLIATRVLAALDDVVATQRACTVADAPAAEQSAAPVATETVPPPSSAIEIPEVAEESADLAIVSDETQSNPANVDAVSEASAAVARMFAELDQALLDTNIPILNEPVTPATVSDDARRSDKQRVIVVDDSPSVRKQLEIELIHFDVEVDYAASARQAIEMLENSHYDVAFLDVVLPDWDGFQICKRIKSKSKSTLVVMLTGKATPSDKLKGTLAGCDAYLAKPVGRLTFQSTVKHYLRVAPGTQALGR